MLVQCVWGSLTVFLLLLFLLKPQVNSPYLEDHLMHMIKQDQSKVHNLDLLWRYYEKNRNFGKAAHVLARLADMHRLALPRHQHKQSTVAELGQDGGQTVELWTTTKKKTSIGLG